MLIFGVGDVVLRIVLSFCAKGADFDDETSFDSLVAFSDERAATSIDVGASKDGTLLEKDV